MKKLKALLFCLLIPAIWVSAKAQQKIEGQITGKEDQWIYLFEFRAFQARQIDSTKADEKGHFAFTLPEDAYKGMYRIMYEKSDVPREQRFMDFVSNQKESVKFRTHGDYAFDSLEILKGKENRAFYDYQRTSSRHFQKYNVLLSLLDNYPEEDSFYRRAEEHRKNLEREYDAYRERFVKEHRGTVTGRFIVFINSFVFDPDEQNPQDMQEFFLSRANLSDSIHYRYNLLGERINDYLDFFTTGVQNSYELQEAQRKFVDALLKRLRTNMLLYEGALEYLVHGFEVLGDDQMLEYLYENYINPESCEDEELKESVRQKINRFKKVQVGAKAPEIVAPDPDGDLIRLSDISSPYTLVVFWSSECGQCREDLPRLRSIYRQLHGQGLEILAVSLDRQRENWEHFIEEGEYEWINISELKGWDGINSRNYHIRSTPSMFLLNEDHEIIGRPRNIADLRAYLRNIY